MVSILVNKASSGCSELRSFRGELTNGDFQAPPSRRLRQIQAQIVLSLARRYGLNESPGHKLFVKIGSS